MAHEATPSLLASEGPGSQTQMVGEHRPAPANICFGVLAYTVASSPVRSPSQFLKMLGRKILEIEIPNLPRSGLVNLRALSTPLTSRGVP